MVLRYAERKGSLNLRVVYWMAKNKNGLFKPKIETKSVPGHKYFSQ